MGERRRVKSFVKEKGGTLGDVNLQRQTHSFAFAPPACQWQLIKREEHRLIYGGSVKAALAGHAECSVKR